MELRTILVPVDFSEHSARALEVARGLARRFGSKLHLLHSYPIPASGLFPFGLVIPEAFDRDIREAADGQLSRWCDKAAADGIPVERTITPIFPSEAIAQVAEEIGADLIVMGTRGLGGVKHVVLGSVAERTVRTAPCPVLTVKASDAPRS
jgi:nucleotide-binding universal stress UspA family protein